MNKLWKTKWIKALRSGKYNQAQGKLYEEKDDSYCCLGVLCEVGKIPSIKGLGVTAYDGDYEVLTPRLLKKFGLSPIQQEELAEKNDKGASFTWIADYIEKEL